MPRSPTRPPLRRRVLALVAVVVLGGSVHAAGPPPEQAAPVVLVNQVGYFRHGPRRATLVSAADEPLAWELRDRDGRAVARGWTEPFGHDPAVGAATHVIDFSAVDTGGDGFVLAVGDARSLPFRIGMGGRYADLRDDAIEFFYPARSGVDIEERIAGAWARPAGHAVAPDDGAINRGDRQVPCAAEAGCPPGYVRDVVGGWYDAGDHGKYAVSGAIAVSHLLALYERAASSPGGAAAAGLTDGALAVPEARNGVPDVLDEARWELEWLLSMQVPDGTAPFDVDGRRADLSGMVHHKVHDDEWTPLPTEPHADAARRLLSGPSTAATLDMAAVAAHAARLWRDVDPEFADRLLAAAVRAFGAARAFPRALYAPPPDRSGSGGGAYDDATVADEFYWAATELYLTTGRAGYRDLIVNSPVHRADVFASNGFTWRDVAPLARLRLATVPNELPELDAIRATVLDAADRLSAIQARQSTGVPYAGADGAYEWGSNAQVLHNVMVLAVAADVSSEPGYRDAAVEAVDYLFGRNALARSYVTGWGAPGHTSENQHSRWWAAQLDGDLPHPPDGALAGGPNSDESTWDPTIAELQASGSCAPQACYVDDIRSWATNEVAVNWNAALAWVAGYLATAR